MKRFAKKSGCLVICFILAVSVFAAGCGKSENGKETSQASGMTTTATASAEPVKIRLMNRLNEEVVLDNNPVFKEIEKKLNIIVEYEAPPMSSFLDKQQIVMASGDIPDIMYSWGGADNNYEKWAQDGLLANLDDKLPNYPNLMSNISKDMWEAVRSLNTGKIHGVPKPHIKDYWGYVINQKWLDKLGLKAPNTVDEFIAVCKAFTTQDPDGNSKDDTYGVTTTAGGTWKEFMSHAFDVPRLNANGAKDVDGQYKFKERFQGYIPYLTFIKQLYADKLLDPEFFTGKVYEDQQKLFKDRVGIAYGGPLEVMGAKTSISDAVTKLTWHAPLQNKNGESYNYLGPAMWGCWMISATSKNVDACLKLLDYGNSEEGFILFGVGVKGLDYTDYDINTRSATKTPEQIKQVVKDTSDYMTLAYVYKGDTVTILNADSPEDVAKYHSDLDAYLKVTKQIEIPAVRVKSVSDMPNAVPDLIKKRDEYELRYVLGEITEQQFKDFIDNEYLKNPAVAAAEKDYIDYMNKTAQK